MNISWFNFMRAILNCSKNHNINVAILQNNDNGSTVEFFLQTLRGGSHLHLPKKLMLKPDRQTMSQDVFYNLDAATSSGIP